MRGRAKEKHQFLEVKELRGKNKINCGVRHECDEDGFPLPLEDHAAGGVPHTAG